MTPKKVKCGSCKQIKPYEEFFKSRNKKYGLHESCKVCHRKSNSKYRSTENGFVKRLYSRAAARLRVEQTRKPKRYSPPKRLGSLERYKCHVSWPEFLRLWEKHKEAYGMKSSWGPPHKPVTMVCKGRDSRSALVLKQIPSNLSVDRLDPERPYTIQNIIFIRNDENKRKKDSTYRDCLIYIEKYKARFIEMKAI